VDSDSGPPPLKRDVLLGCFDANGDTLTDLCIWNTKDVFTVDPCNPIILIPKAIDFDLTGFANVDRWLLIGTLCATV
jgi:hypothetical protein